MYYPRTVSECRKIMNTWCFLHNYCSVILSCLFCFTYILTLHCNLFYKLHEIIIMFYQIVCYSHTVLHRETRCNFKNYFHSLKLKLVSLCNANQENVWIETLFLPTELRISINIVIVKHWITRISWMNFCIKRFFSAVSRPK